MDNTLDPRWQAAVSHSRYLANMLQARPELIPELLATWAAWRRLPKLSKA